MSRHLIVGVFALLVALPAAAADPPPPTVEPAAPVVAPPPSPPPPVAPPPAAPVETPSPIAGYHGHFFLRDRNDWFVLFPKGRLQVDSYLFPVRGDVPMGVDENSARDPRPRSTIFVRRARIELQGTVVKHFDFHLAGEFGTVAATGAYGTITDAFVTVNYTPWAQLQIGQFDAPFTQENRTSDKAIDFMERSLAVRAFGAPTNKEIGAMIWGYAPNKVVYYSLGVFDGDGQNFRNQDNLPAVIGRAFVAPLAPWAKGRRWMEELEVGGSIWWQRNQNLGMTAGVSGSTSGGSQEDLFGMTTQGAVSFFSSSYGNGKDPMGNAVRSHLVPDGDTLKWAVEAHLPWNRFGLKWELIHQTIGLAQFDDTSASRGAAVTTAATLDGYGTYVEAYAWLLGGREMIEAPGLESHPRLNLARPLDEPRWALQLLAKWDHVGFDVKGLPTPPAGTGTDPAEGHYAVDAIEIGVNAWCTKHVRLTANYAANFIGGFGKRDDDAANMKANYFYKNNLVDHEILLRIAIGL